MTRFCLMDVGSTYTKGCWVDTDQVGILAWASAPTTASTDINEGIQHVLNQLKTIYPDFNYESMRLCSSAKGGLRMVAIGLVEDLTLKAARMACANAGAKLVGAYSHKLNLQELKEIETLKPEIDFTKSRFKQTCFMFFKSIDLHHIFQRFPLLCDL